MAQRSLEKTGRLAEEALNSGIELVTLNGQVRHLLEEHRTIHPRLQGTLRIAESEYRRRLRRLIRAMNGGKR
ncbi:MAG: hypothetical protein QXO51_00010 [Halobacteria archaeon]